MPRRFPKKTVYGQYKQDNCVFCSRMGTQKNEQGMVVCLHHRRQTLEEIKCVCGSWLEQRSGRFGPFFSCVKCGPIDFNRGLEIKKLSLEALAAKTTKLAKETAVSIPNVSFSSAPISGTSMSNSSTYQASIPTARRVEEKQSKKETTISTNDVEYFD